MNERHPEEEALFEAARRLNDPAQRAAFLEAACVGNPGLRRQLDDLFAAQGDAEEWFRPLPQPRASQENPPVLSAPVTEEAGALIGRYKLLQKIGEGGFGVVYLAEQKEPVKRRVALKIIKLGMDTRQVVARFEAERQALAMMDHPNIAKILEAGATDSPLTPALSPDGGEGVRRESEGDAHAKAQIENQKSQIHQGRPYFVMKLVRGVPITQYCDENQLSPGERLQLFLQVCEAVQHAHQKGIIHRDLKPSNILITVNDGRAVPKVIDFGIAKATQQELTEKTIVTQFHHFIGTPAYISPEQAQMSSLDIDTRSDIYSLGVLLYELLTGRTPFDGKELLASGLDAMRQTIREKEPPRPSTRLSTMAEAERTTTARLRKSEPPQLIHLLRGDLDWIVMKCLEKDRTRRYDTANSLAGDIERHLSNEPVVARPPTAVYRFQKLVRRNKLPFAAATFAATALILTVVISSWQAVEAKRSEGKAKEQAEIARSIKDFLTEQLLGTTNPFVDPEPDSNKRPLLERIARQLEGKFADRPLIEAQLRYALGEAFKDVGEFALSVAQFEKSLAIRRRVLTPRHSDSLETAAGLAEAYIGCGRRAEAEKLLAEAVAVARSSPHTLTKGAGWVLRQQGYLLFRDGRAAEAVPYLKEAVAILKRTLDANDPRLRSGIGIGLLAHATCAAGQWKEAQTLISEALQQCERDHGAESPLAALLQRSQACFFLQRGKWQDALPLLERSLPIHRRVLGTNSQHTLEAEFYLGWAWEQKGDAEEAAKLYAGLLPRWAKYFPFDLARSHCCRIAQFFMRHQRFDEAKAAYARLTESFDLNPPEWSWEFDNLIEATAATKGWPAVAEILRRNFDRSFDSLSLWLNKACVFRYVGDEDRYRQVVTNVLALAPTAKSLDDQRLIFEIAGLGPFEPAAERVKQLDLLMEALHFASRRGTTNQQVWSSRAIACLQLRLGRLRECLTSLENSAAQETRSERGLSLMTKALCLHRSGNAGAARAAFDESEAIIMPMLPEPLSQNEGFLPAYQLNYLALRREAQALLASDHPKP